MLCAALLALALSGCLPFTVAQSPALNGKLVDATSKQPISSAKVSAQACPDQAVITGADGTFHLDQCIERKWYLALPIDIVPNVIPVTFEANGYQPREFRADRSPGWSVYELYAK